MQLGTRSLTFAAHVDPKLMDVVKLALSMSSVDWGYTEDQSRTVAQQNEKYHSGASQLPAGPKARHMIQSDGFSKAVDNVPYIDDRFQWGDKNWQVKKLDGTIIEPFYTIASNMRLAALKLGVVVRWGAVWDRPLNSLGPTPQDMKEAVHQYTVRHVGPDFLDGPHFELPL